MSKAARFWFAPGVEVMPNRLVPNPPPHMYIVMVREPTRAIDEVPFEQFVAPQTARFRLADGWGPSGEVAHYELDSSPPNGWRWLAVNGTIHAERVS